MAETFTPTQTSVRDGADDAHTAVRAIARAAQVAARKIRGISTERKNAALCLIASGLRERAAEIAAANELDMKREAENLSEALLDRLRLDEERVGAVADAVDELIGLADPVGQTVAGRLLTNGMRADLRRVPLGVVGMIYEARPNVTVDAAALALKAGNAVILRGGSAAAHTNAALVAVMRDCLVKVGLPADLVASIDPWGRAGARELMRARGLVDVVIPRGGAGLINTVVEQATVPVIETGTGNCHTYIHASADLGQARAIIRNAKVQRPGVCNATETLLIDAEIATELLPVIARDLLGDGVRLHVCERAAQILADVEAAPGEAGGIVPAEEDDWGREYLSLDLAVKVTDSVADAVGHIEKYSSGHTEAIIARDSGAIDSFVRAIDSAAVIVNASTRYTDGGQLGLGAEIGISTQKLHARGPMGLDALTTQTWVIAGDGHIRGEQRILPGQGLD